MNIVVTGASGGIGNAIIHSLCQTGNHTIIAVVKDTRGFKKLKDIPNVFTIAMDITKTDLITSRLLTTIGKHCQTIDVLIHNAGILIHKPFLDLTEADWHKTFQTNLFSVVAITKVLMPLLKASKTAHVVLVGSMGGLGGSQKFSGLSSYSASKAALANLAESLAVELTPFNISVNCLSLGSVETSMFKRAFPEQKASMQPETVAKHIAAFALAGTEVCNGKIIPLSIATP